MRYCVVKNCLSWKQADNLNIKYFRFPKNPDVKKKWIEACGKENVNAKTGTICSLHFTEDDWRMKDRLLNIPIAKRLLDHDAVPTQLVHCNDVLSINRSKRCEKRTAKKIVHEAIKEHDLSLSKKQEEYNTEIQTENLDNTGTSTSVEVQTDVEMECARELKIIEMEKKIKSLEKENTLIKNENKQLQNLESSVRNIFTNGQIKKLKNPNKKINWTLDDISAATCLHSAGPRAYRFMYKKKFPLPGPSTLRQWATKISVRPVGRFWAECET